MDAVGGLFGIGAGDDDGGGGDEAGVVADEFSVGVGVFVGGAIGRSGFGGPCELGAGGFGDEGDGCFAAGGDGGSRFGDPVVEGVGLVEAGTVLLDAAAPDVLVGVFAAGLFPVEDGVGEVAGLAVFGAVVAHAEEDAGVEVLGGGEVFELAFVGAVFEAGVDAAGDGAADVVADFDLDGLGLFAGGLEGGGEELFEFGGFGVFGADDAVFIDEEGDGHGGDGEEVEGVGHDGPVHLVPLHEELGAVDVLFLGDAEDLEFSGGGEVSGFGVPPGHVAAAACSPAGEDVDDGFLAVEVGDGVEAFDFRAVDEGELDVGQGFADGEGLGVGRHGEEGGEEQDEAHGS